MAPQCRFDQWSVHQLHSKFWFALVVTLATIAFPVDSHSQEDAATLGIESTKPKSGKFVKLEGGGFMVPYQATIPGTKAKYTMIPIPGGKFMMGSPASEKGRNKDEGPQFQVTVKPFWMSKYELTWAEYQAYMELDKTFKKLQLKRLRIAEPDKLIDAVTAPSELYDPTFTYSPGEGLDQPAATMTQFSAMQYTKWLSLTSDRFYRLPTEAEWEYACRAGTKTAYHFGDDPNELKKYGWVDDDDEERHAVGKLLPNQFGLHDMHGNVSEWVLDGYSSKGFEDIAEGESLTSENAYVVPRKEHQRVAKGGSFESKPEQSRSASRLGTTKDWSMEDPNIPRSPWWYTDSPSSGVGFRIMRPLTPPESDEDKNKFWVTDLKKFGDAQTRIKDQGRGAIAPVDLNLPEDIKKLESSKK